MDQQHKHLRKIIDASGFPLQIALENEIKREDSIHRWNVLAHEHPWSHPLTSSDGFIDIILGLNYKRIIIECKLRRDDNWIFLIPNNMKQSMTTGRFYIAHISKANYEQIKCEDLALSKPLLEAEFCIIKKDAGENLENIASKLILSTECLISEELILKKKKNTHEEHIYYPAIVTASNLYICRFDPLKVSLNNGMVDESTSHIEPINYLKFTKSLTTQLTQDANPSTITDTNNNKKRTVFIINSNHISEFLKEVV